MQELSITGHINMSHSLVGSHTDDNLTLCGGIVVHVVTFVEQVHCYTLGKSGWADCIRTQIIPFEDAVVIPNKTPNKRQLGEVLK